MPCVAQPTRGVAPAAGTQSRVHGEVFEFPAEEGDEESIPANFAYSTDDTTLTLVSSCPAGFAGFTITAGYSATADELTI